MPTISIEVEDPILIKEYTSWTKECVFGKTPKTLYMLNAFYEGVYPFRITPLNEKMKIELHYDRAIPECKVVDFSSSELCL